MYHRILLPTDGSDRAKEAAEHAFSLANRYNATLCVLHVVDDRPYDAEGITGAIVDAAVERGERMVSEIAEMAGSRGVSNVETAVETGVPSRRILEYVDENDIDLIVMSTQGRTGVERYVLGSVTEKTVRTSPVPVHTVRADEPE